MENNIKNVEFHYHYPSSVKEAAERFISCLHPEDREYLENRTKDNFDPRIEMEMCRHMRNEFGLWQDNEDLIKETGEEHPDDASSVIFEKVLSIIKESVV